jgi:hypothetical protein
VVGSQDSARIGKPPMSKTATSVVNILKALRIGAYSLRRVPGRVKKPAAAQSGEGRACVPQ